VPETSGKNRLVAASSIVAVVAAAAEPMMSFLRLSISPSGTKSRRPLAYPSCVATAIFPMAAAETRKSRPMITSNDWL